MRHFWAVQDQRVFDMHKAVKCDGFSYQAVLGGTESFRLEIDQKVSGYTDGVRIDVTGNLVWIDFDDIAGGPGQGSRSIEITGRSVNGCSEKATSDQKQ